MLLLVLVGCGDDRAQQTEFGSVKSVRAYREMVEDIIVEANAIEQDFRETAVGSTGQATGNNLSTAAMRLRPRLVAAIDQITSVLSEMGVETLAVDMPFGTMHLMGMLRFADHDLAVAWPRRNPTRWSRPCAGATMRSPSCPRPTTMP